MKNTDPQIDPPVHFDQGTVNHIKQHWFDENRDSDENRRWHGPQANDILLHGLKEAVRIALEAYKPLDITWVCPGRADPDPEVLVIKSDFQITALLITPRRWWRLSQLSSGEKGRFRNDQTADYEILFEYGDEDQPVDGPVVRKAISLISV